MKQINFRKSTILTVFLLFLFFTAAAAGAQDLVVEYLDGFLDLKTSSGWEEVYIGDTIPSGSVLRLDFDSLAELTGGKTIVTLTKEGVYNTGELMKASSSMSSIGLGNLIAGKIGSMIKKSERDQPSAVGGVRAAEVDTGDEIEWISSETTELIETGKNLLAQEKNDSALSVFEEALDFADFEEESEVYFYLGYTYDLLGQTASALRNISYVEADDTYDFYHDLALLKGKLLIETFAYEEALGWPNSYINKNKSNNSARDTVQTAHLLSSFAYSGMGRDSNARSALSESIELDPSSETASAARKLLNQM